MVMQAGDVAMRVVVRNVGGNLVYLAFSSNDLAQANSLGSTYQLPAGQADVFVLAPKQTLIAAAGGGGGLISITASEAIPIGHHYLES